MAKKLVQIIYISRSTSAPVQLGKGVDPVVARILAKSRSNNRKNDLVGVLYFGDGCFFQCLEGEETAVDTLYAKILRDPRHKDLKIISRKAIEERSFGDWSMKYVPVEQAMTKLLQSREIHAFDPYRFDHAMTQQVISLLLNTKASPELSDPVSDPINKRASVPINVSKRISGKSLVLAMAAVLATGGLLMYVVG